MKASLFVGPLLGYEGDGQYTVCFLSGKNIEQAKISIDGRTVKATILKDIPDGRFWRAEVRIEPGEKGRFIQYDVHLNSQVASDTHNRKCWEFYIPANDEEPKFAYASCNGVSKADLITKIDDPFALWRHMSERHKERPFSLLLMGGDQVYADSIWEKVKTLTDWSSLKLEDQKRRKPTKIMSRQIDQFYSKLYRERWSDEYMSYMLASVPSLMMWDDHDIFDGWGSFPKELQETPIFSEIFKYAKKYFELFQIRSLSNHSLLSRDGAHYAFCLSFNSYTILGLDNRSDRTIRQVMSAKQWEQVLATLKNITEGTLLIMSAVPVVYRDFSFTETAFDVTPWDENLTDDLKDHWRAKEHQGERSRLIMRLLENAKLRHETDQPIKTVILSGDVHVGCLGVITDFRNDNPIKIHQIVSSGIVHPAPSLLQWLGISAVTNDNIEVINEERTIEASMLKPVGSKRYIRERNFVTLEEGTDKKLWVNWITEDCMSETSERPEYPITPRQTGK